MSLAHALILIAQVGPFQAQPLPPTGLEDRRSRTEAPSTPAAPTKPEATALGECLEAAKVDPPAAAAMAGDWAERASPAEAAQAQFCLGSARAALDNWPAAEAAFTAGRDAAGTTAGALRAQLGAMAGTAALLQNAPDRAIALLDTAHADAVRIGDTRLAADISLDRSRALVALKRDDEAAAALARAREGNADNGDAWLLSATLARRRGQLDQAQAWIERAATLAPRDPLVGLEAGVIAVLAGRDEAARKSWQSVLAAAPDSAAAKTAQDYLAQLGGAPALPAEAAAP